MHRKRNGEAIDISFKGLHAGENKSE